MTERFTLYDVFAVLVPGVIFNFLIYTTLNHATNIEFIEWSGGFGDATVLVITGYASGIFLQGMGKLIVESTWLYIRGGQPTATLLLEKSNILTSDFKNEVTKALANYYGELTITEGAKDYIKQLEEKTYRAYKKVSSIDPKTERFLAEHHGMRAFGVGFLILGIYMHRMIDVDFEAPRIE
jgi:hypothetical protein